MKEDSFEVILRYFVGVLLFIVVMTVFYGYSLLDKQTQDTIFWMILLGQGQH